MTDDDMREKHFTGYVNTDSPGIHDGTPSHEEWDRIVYAYYRGMDAYGWPAVGNDGMQEIVFARDVRIPQLTWRERIMMKLMQWGWI